ncbi:glycoside hydrolase family 35 protein [Paenibacillus sp. JDR-2]|uniref:glycoside hydrolase family 35 protein n=1 Tax=Paenibacillus sp. (strain JDR-2) TaxID=324057 RepID=UPI000166657A|nr:beta-galactosidase family protein [Paenibacillus sp. JDR-2]ACS99842.1 Beta-galactosidase [Paenibacillus sp. JDR-2]
MSPLTIQGKQLMLNDRPFRIIAGAIHYFRVVPEYWRDRLLKLKACGFNTVETYVPWNFHEPEEGRFVFEGMADLEKFIALAGELGLYAIVRPSPYICAEWEFGGLPAWLLKDPGMRLRCSYKPFLDKADAYYDELIPRLTPFLSTKGGPLIAMQIENEYGSYGNDKTYLNYLKEALVKRGVDVLLFTSDGPEDFMLQGGMVEGVWETVNFGSRSAEAFAKLQEYQPDQPLMCMEFWNGWFDHWGETHHTRGAADVALVLDEMLAAGASVNFYMFHGGTNFGFFSGANYTDRLLPTVTSYDYDSPLSESGELTEKYYAVREVIAKYAELGPLELPAQIVAKSFGSVRMTGQARLLASLDELSVPIPSVCPEPMEQYGQNSGFILYATHLTGPRPASRLNLQEVHDRALIFIDGVFKGVIERSNPEHDLVFDVPPGGVELAILVENMGRINYGPHMKDVKGITEGVRFGQQFLFNWTVRPLPLDDLSKLQFSALSSQPCLQPSFYRGEFEVDEPADTFLSMKGWTKGVAYMNGFNLGRYWEIAPQETLYIPGPLLRTGKNEIIVFELHAAESASVSLLDCPVLNKQ